MDCNKDQALRVKEVAERKFAEKDYVGAKKFAQKAKQLCPGLDFISLFITIIEIYWSRERIENGESGWHEVLGVEESANLPKQCESYCNLVEAVKGGGNNVVGAEGALQILSEAWCMLTETFWTKCSMCRLHFQFSKARVNKELVCINCGKCFVAVAVPPGCHPTNQRTMSSFKQQRQERSNDGGSVVLALDVTSYRRSKRMKKDDGESSGHKDGRLVRVDEFGNPDYGPE